MAPSYKLMNFSTMSRRKDLSLMRTADVCDNSEMHKTNQKNMKELQLVRRFWNIEEKWVQNWTHYIFLHMDQYKSASMT